MKLVVAVGVVVSIAVAGCSSPGSPEQTPSPSVSSAPSPSPTPTPTPTPTFDRALYSIDDPTSPWVVVNKLRPLNPIDYAVSDPVYPAGIVNKFNQPLNRPAALAVEAMYAAATQAGLNLRINSATRDYATQVQLYNNYVARDGREAADTYSARPGYSEHQTGWAADFNDGGECYLVECFADTGLGLWLAANAWQYGFILRYPKGAEGTTGYIYEPWHFRYVGPELATEMHETGVATLEEFFALGPAPGYAG